MTQFRVELLVRESRDGFDCGNESLNEYLKKRARQDQKRRIAVCYLLIEQRSETVAGYYTLSAASIDAEELPAELLSKLPRYPEIPAVRLGRLAVGKSSQGQGAGGAMLFDAITRAAKSEIGAYCILVDAIDEVAVRFYQHHGFLSLTSNDRVLFLPISEGIRKLTS